MRQCFSNSCKLKNSVIGKTLLIPVGWKNWSAKAFWRASTSKFFACQNGVFGRFKHAHHVISDRWAGRRLSFQKRFGSGFRDVQPRRPRDFLHLKGSDGRGLRYQGLREEVSGLEGRTGPRQQRKNLEPSDQ